ncbi:hypothetical protein [Niastella vici]|nr:hypothetical protein [Niastella vici]
MKDAQPFRRNSRKYYENSSRTKERRTANEMFEETIDKIYNR